MNYLSKSNRPWPASVNNLWIRLGGSFVAAQFIVFYGLKGGFLEQFISLPYYLALLASFIIALVIFEWIYRTTVFFDKRVPWENYVIWRGMLQFVVGWVVAIIIAFLMAALYYSLYNIRISNTGYMQYLLILVVAYITLINLYYNWGFISTAEKGRWPDEIRVAEEIVPRAGEVLGDDAAAVIYLEGRTVMAKDASGGNMPWPYDTIIDSLSVLPAGAYILVRSNVIVQARLIDRKHQNGGQEVQDIP